MNISPELTALRARLGTRAEIIKSYRDLLLRMGAYRRFVQIDWASVERLLFICKGNICRSPYAEFSAKRRGLVVESAGTQARTGAPADPMARSRAACRGIDLSVHRSKHVEELSIRGGDLLVFAEPSHLHALPRSMARDCQHTFLQLWGRAPSVVLPDPYGGNAERFDQCFSEIDSALDGIEGRLNITGSGRPPVAAARPGQQSPASGPSREVAGG